MHGLREDAAVLFILTTNHVESALDEMLFSGGSLNLKLLGGAIQE